jgi:uncharacterized membrane protein YdbT with pleckstrin-like domain
MSYIESVLQPGEVVIGQTRLHWFIYLTPLAILVLGLAVFIVGASFDPEIRRFIDIAGLVVLLIAVARLLGAWITRSSTELAVTNRRVIHKTGLLSRRTQEMNREKVESIDVYQSLAGRMFGYGTILVRGIGSTWEPFANIADPLAFRSHITAG